VDNGIFQAPQGEQPTNVQRGDYDMEEVSGVTTITFTGNEETPFGTEQHSQQVDRSLVLDQQVDLHINHLFLQVAQQWFQLVEQYLPLALEILDLDIELEFKLLLMLVFRL
jgi:hypothetical protein